ncbi:cation diffusion facilitator family transporter [Colibacter massiliensis]|uniref:cation diffusion facilitator family transporter n=1 Tax=Colibacter massiliensis TaxID=1852379 RepID=UPI003F8FE6AD
MQLNEEAAMRNKGITVASLKGIGSNMLLVIFKVIIGLSSHSIAIILDAVNNLTDILSSVLTVAGTRLAGKRADKEHPFGHGRIEYITTMAIAFIILSAGLISLKESAEHILHPVTSTFALTDLLIISAAIIVKIFMGFYFRKEGKRWQSDALSASAVDALYDAFLTGATLVSSLLVYFFRFDIQGYVGAVIGICIIRAAIGIVHDMYNHLIGIRADDTLIRKLKETIASYPHVGGVYDLILNSYGPGETIGSVHISLPDTLTIADVHPLNKRIASDIYDKFGIVMTIGVYAENQNDLKALQIKKELDDILSLYPHVLQIHAFYVQECEKTIYYDLIFDFDEPDPRGALESIEKELQKRIPEYRQFAVLDTDFSN